MTAVPPIVLTDTGFVIPQESEILAGVRVDLNAAFGGNLNPALETPQGQLATTEAAAIGAQNDAILSLFNGFDPAFAAGRAQDALARMYFLERFPARPTVVTAQVNGGAGVVIPIGALARSTDGRVYACTQAVTIPIGGTIDATFACTTDGPISCPAGSLNRIYQSISGWDAITNADEGVLGSDVESRAAFEARRVESVAINARGILPAIQGAVLALEDVLDAYTTENPTSAPLTVGGYTLAPHSLYVAVAGGTDEDVAEAIWRKKAPGCAYNGNTTVTVQDSNSGYVIPIPEYDVTFERPSAQAIEFAIELQDSPAVPPDYVTQVRNAVIAAFAGDDGGPRARIGARLLALRYFSPIQALGAWAAVISIKLGPTTPTLDYYTVDIDRLPTIAAGDIAVTLI